MRTVLAIWCTGWAVFLITQACSATTTAGAMLCGAGATIELLGGVHFFTAD